MIVFYSNDLPRSSLCCFQDWDRIKYDLVETIDLYIFWYWVNLYVITLFDDRWWRVLDVCLGEEFNVVSYNGWCWYMYSWMSYL
jgi:hypothetical protein